MTQTQQGKQLLGPTVAADGDAERAKEIIEGFKQGGFADAITGSAAMYGSKPARACANEGSPIVFTSRSEATMLLQTVLTIASLTSHSGGLSPDASSCLTRHGNLQLSRDQQPNILSPRFTANGDKDLVIAVYSKSNKANGVLVCPKAGSDIVFLTSDRLKANDNASFQMSSKWKVCPKSYVSGLRRYYAKAPSPVNESICFVWEDAEAVLYWDGTHIKWISLVP